MGALSGFCAVGPNTFGFACLAAAFGREFHGCVFGTTYGCGLVKMTAGGVFRVVPHGTTEFGFGFVRSGSRSIESVGNGTPITMFETPELLSA